jgi:zinc/manganese transport system permease protein
MDTIIDYLHYPFVQHALIAGTLASILGAVVGYFVVLRNVIFATDALSHIGFTGGAAAALFGLDPLHGILIFSIVAAAGIGVFGDRLQRSDVAIGMVLAVSLGLGTLFLHLSQGYASHATSILFGAIFGVSTGQVIEMAVLSAVALAALALFSRKLLFASIQPRLAEARGLSIPGLSVAFMVVLATSVSLASQVVGILLVFTLVIAPAGIVLRLSRSFWRGITMSVALSLVVVWTGLLLDCVTGWPATFWIPTMFFAIYLGVEIWCRAIRRE